MKSDKDLLKEGSLLFETLLDGLEYKTSVGNWNIIITDDDCLIRIKDWLDEVDEI